MKLRVRTARLLLFAVGALWLRAGQNAAAAADASPVVAHIALISDPHLNHDTAEDRPLYRAHFEHVIADVNAAGVDFAVIAGDLTQNGGARELMEFKGLLAGFKVPVFCVPGNHDVGPKFGVKGGKNEPAPVSSDRVAAYEAKLGPSFFVKTCAGVRVIGLNASVLGSGLPEEAAEWKLLETELATPAKTPTIVFQHYPPFTKTVDEAGGPYWNLEPAPRARLLALLHQGGVRTLLTGHLHYPLERHDGDLKIVTTLPVSFGLPRGKQPEGWTYVTLHADGTCEHEFRTTEPPNPPLKPAAKG